MQLSFEGFFVYRFGGRYILLDTERSVRIGSFESESQVNSAWKKYIGNKRHSPSSCEYTDRDKEVIR